MSNNPENTDNNAFKLYPCNTDKSCKAKLDKRQSLNIQNIKKHFKVISDAGIALVIEAEGLEVIVHGYSELVFKAGKDIKEEKLKKIAKDIYSKALSK